jgi:hypothetical protein
MGDGTLHIETISGSTRSGHGWRGTAERARAGAVRHGRHAAARASHLLARPYDVTVRGIRISACARLHSRRRTAPFETRCGIIDRMLNPTRSAVTIAVRAAIDEYATVLARLRRRASVTRGQRQVSCHAGFAFCSAPRRIGVHGGLWSAHGAEVSLRNTKTAKRTATSGYSAACPNGSLTPSPALRYSGTTVPL